MNIDEAKELLKADLLTAADLDALRAAEREACDKALVMVHEWHADRHSTPSLHEYRAAPRKED